jgi:cell filamentation protein
MATDPYVYPGTTVLKNLAGIEDPKRLQQFEAVSTAHRISELSFNPVPGAFDKLAGMVSSCS